MEHPSVISTEQPQTVLRIFKPEDAAVYLTSVQKSRDHLSVYIPGFKNYHPSLLKLERSIIPPSRLMSDDEAFFGIWVGDEFAGTTSLFPDAIDQAEIGYWLDIDHLHRGYATVSVNALTKYCKTKYSLITAKVARENEQSARVVERCNFSEDPVGEPKFRIFKMNGYSK